jgi:uncharacterized protein YjbJ (UPF0337 family)
VNKAILKGRWTEAKGMLKRRWGRLTGDDLTRIEGRQEELAGILQRRYGLAKEQADKDSKAFFAAHDQKSNGKTDSC